MSVPIGLIEYQTNILTLSLNLYSKPSFHRKIVYWLDANKGMMSSLGRG